MGEDEESEGTSEEGEEEEESEGTSEDGEEEEESEGTSEEGEEEEESEDSSSSCSSSSGSSRSSSTESEEGSEDNSLSESWESQWHHPDTGETWNEDHSLVQEYAKSRGLDVGSSSKGMSVPAQGVRRKKFSFWEGFLDFISGVGTIVNGFAKVALS